MSNRKTGNAFEARFCDMLSDEGFWVHNLAQNQAGQPADVIAVRGGKAYLIDCKVCENDDFRFSRIEGNQHTAMELWKECGNKQGWFALELSDKSVWMIGSHLLDTLSALDITHLSKTAIKHHGQSLKGWIEYAY